MSVLLTGTAGFIGFHVAKALLDRGEKLAALKTQAFSKASQDALKDGRLQAVIRRSMGNP